MTYALVLVVVLLVAGGLWRLGLAAGRSGGDPEHRGGADVTDTSVRPPAHPDRPVPGSDRARAASRRARPGRGGR